MANPSDITVQMIENAFRTNKAQSMLLGGHAGSGGGSGGPPGGFIGKLPQTKVTYDLSELASSGIPASGVSLLDNLNHIRYRIDVLETASGGGGGGHVIEDISSTFTQRANLKFLGNVAVVDNSGNDSTDITITSPTLSGYMQRSVYDSDLDGIVDNSELLNNHADTYFQTALGFTPEDVANKTNDTTLAGDSATLYPTEHAVKTYVDGIALSGVSLSGYVQRSGVTTSGNLAIWDGDSLDKIKDGGAVPSSGRILIAENTPSGVTVTTFSSIPGTYKKLILEFTFRSSQTANAVDGILEFNADTAAGNYRYQGDHWNSFGSGNDAGADRIFAKSGISAASAPTSQFTIGTIEIPQYANTNFMKWALIEFGMAYDDTSVFRQWFNAGLNWKNTSAITQIDLRLSAGNYAANSVVRLYGEN